jgi:hypothetical protein
MKTRGHHNTDGRRQIARGRTQEHAARLAKRYGIPLRIGTMLKRFNAGRVEKEQPGGICYALEASDAPLTVFGEPSDKGVGR